MFEELREFDHINATATTTTTTTIRMYCYFSYMHVLLLLSICTRTTTPSCKISRLTGRHTSHHPPTIPPARPPGTPPTALFLSPPAGKAGSAISFTANRPIAVGEEITIGYVDVAEPTYVRQRSLWVSKQFNCRCVRVRGSI